MRSHPLGIPLDVPQPKPNYVFPDAVKTMLADPNLDENMKSIIELQAKITGSFFAQSLGGVYEQNIEGVPSWNKPRESSATKAKYDFERRKEPNAMRNDLNVSTLSKAHCIGIEK